VTPDLSVYNTQYAFCSAVMGIGCAYRLWVLRRAPKDPLLWALALVFAFPTASFATATPAAYVRLDRWAGVPNLATLIIYGCTVGSCAAYQVVLLLWSHPTEQVRTQIHRRVLGFGLVFVTMAVLFAAGTVDDAEHPIDFDAHYAAAPYIAQFLMLFYFAFAVACISIARLCWHYATVVEPWLRRALRLLTIGTAFCLGYCLLKVVSVAASWWGTDLTQVNLVWAPLSASVGGLLLTIGITLPLWGPRLTVVGDQVRRARAYRQLEPLWLALYRAVPAIALDPPARPRLDRWSVRDLRHRLYRRVIEIRDGRLALRDYLDPAVAATAYRLAGTASLSGQQRQAVAEAATLKAALMARQHNRPPLDQLVDATDPAGGADVAEETAWLVQVARAFVRSPIVQSIAQESVREHLTERQST
jgi:hypothetical protein